MSVYTFGVRIILNDAAAPIAQDTSIGLYNTQGNSEFRWVQNDVSGVSDWCSSMLAKDGIGAYSREIDLQYGGNVASPGRCSIRIKNTGQFANKLEALDISLISLVVEVILFTDSTESLQWRGFVDNTSFDAKSFSINATGYYTKRRANLNGVNTDFVGSLCIGYLPYAKFIKVIDTKTVHDNQELFTLYIDSIAQNNPTPKTYTFPTRPNDSGWAFVYHTEVEDSDINTSSVVGKFVYVSDGFGKGQLRKIADCYIGGTGNLRTSVYLYQNRIWEKGYISSTDTNVVSAENQPEITILSIVQKYESDRWGWTLYDDNYVGEINAYAFSGGQFFRLPRKAFFVSDGLVAKDFEFFKNDNFSQIDSTDIYPVASIGSYQESNLSKLGISGYTKKHNGVFCAASGFQFDRTTTITEPTLSYVTNTIKNDYTSYKIEADISTGAGTVSMDYYSVVKFTLPEIPDDLQFDTVHFMLRLKTSLNYDALGLSNQDYKVRLIMKSFNNSENILDTDMGDDYWDTQTDWGFIDNYPYYYFVPDSSPDLRDTNYLLDSPFFTTSTSEQKRQSITGHHNFELPGITSIEKYRSISYVCLLIKRDVDITSGFLQGYTENLQFDAAGVMFKKSQTISDNVFCYIRGRKFNSTWGSRKNTSHYISNPIDLLEHVNRLQNWSENSTAPADGWGTGYATNAKIKTSGNGSFDSTATELAAAKAFTIAGQITDYEKLYTDSIKKSVCRNFHLASWVDKNGFECVKRIIDISSVPTDLITLDEIIDRDSITIEEVSKGNVFAEPFVQYNYNVAANSYDGKIAVTNVSQAAYDSSYTPGWVGTDAEEYWLKCKQLLTRSNEVNTPPSDLTDLTWVNGSTGQAIAEEYLKNWIDFQLTFKKKVELTTHFLVAGQWEECHTFSLQLPNQTADRVLYCIVDKLVINPNAQYEVKVSAFVYGGETETIVTYENATDSTEYLESVTDNINRKEMVV